MIACNSTFLSLQYFCHYTRTMDTEETDIKRRLEEQFTEIKAKDKEARKRAVFYTVIPLVVGLMVFGFFTWQTNRALEKLEKAKSDLGQIEGELEKEKKALDVAKNKLVSAKIELEEEGCNKASLEERINDTLSGIETENTPVPTPSIAKTATPPPTKTITPTPTRAPVITSRGSWVIISGDGNLAEARYELNKAERTGYTNSAIYFKQNSYRTIIKFSSDSEARAKLADIRARLSADAYLRDPSRWCPAPQQQSGYFQCSN